MAEELPPPAVAAPQPRTIMVDLRGLDPTGTNGGLQTYVEWLLPWLCAGHRKDFSFLALARTHNHLLAASLLGAEDAVCIESNDDRIWRTGDLRPALVSTSMPFRVLAKKLSVDVLYAPLGSLPFADPGLISIALIADMLHRELPDYLTPEIIAHRERYISFTVQNATMLQCISRSSQERLEHHFPAARGKTFSTYLPIQSRLQQGGSKATSRTLPERPYFFYPANFWPHKNHRLLLSAYQQYEREAGAAAWDLMLCGSDYAGNLQMVRDLARSLGVEGRVHTPGYVDDFTLATLWQHASALVFPSLHEGFGIPLLEAMSVDLPVLSADGYSLPEVAGNAALFFNPRDPAQITARMLEATRDPALRNDLVHRGRAQLKQFNAAAETAKLVAAFQGNLPHAGAVAPQPADATAG